MLTLTYRWVHFLPEYIKNNIKYCGGLEFKIPLVREFQRVTTSLISDLQTNFMLQRYYAVYIKQYCKVLRYINSAIRLAQGKEWLGNSRIAKNTEILIILGIK